MYWIVDLDMVFKMLLITYVLLVQEMKAQHITFSTIFSCERYTFLNSSWTKFQCNGKFNSMCFNDCSLGLEKKNPFKTPNFAWKAGVQFNIVFNFECTRVVFVLRIISFTK